MSDPMSRQRAVVLDPDQFNTIEVLAFEAPSK